MYIKIKKIIKKILPPIIIDIRNFLKMENRLYYYGEYNSWEDAKAENAGYDKPNIVKAEIRAIQKVLNGDAVYEQDGVCFYEKSVHFQIMTCILYAYAQLGGVQIVDIGGALGNMYYRHAEELKGLNIDWNIIEQKQFVEYGKQKLKEINFYYSFEECINRKKIDMILLSSALGYLPEGMEALKQYMKNNISYICVDRTAFFKDENATPCIMRQHVPESIYRAEYPIHIFSWKQVEYLLRKYNYRILFEWRVAGIPIKRRTSLIETNYKGFLLEKL